MLDHFGGSCYSGKASCVLTYSPGPWGGTRGAMAILPVLHELGALPVSKMCHLAAPAELLTEEGNASGEHRMLNQVPQMLDQLEWFACAMKAQRDTLGLWTCPEAMSLKTVVFMGSARNTVPPRGGAQRLGTRVLKHVEKVLASRSK